MIILGLLILSAIILLTLVVWFTARAQVYVQAHPELLAEQQPPAEYLRCHATLSRIIERYHQLKPHISHHTTLEWQAPGGRCYHADAARVEEQLAARGADHHLTWDIIGGVGLRMQPGFTVTDENRRRQSYTVITSSYTFYLLIVPVRGPTLSVHIPTDNNAHAIDFAAGIVALAELMGKRVNVFGFDRPPAPNRQRVRYP